MTEIDKLENNTSKKLGSSKISVTLPDYYYTKMKEIAVKYGGIQGLIIYAIRRYVTKHKTTIKNPRKKRYTLQIDDKLKSEIRELIPEFFLNQNQSFMVCIVDLLKEEGVE